MCIERLLNELPQRPQKRVVWGHWHCDKPTVVFVDESFILLSFDLIDLFFSWEDETMLCHPFGDQQLAIWLKRASITEGFYDRRLHHHPPASKISTFKNMRGICNHYMGLHGTYPKDMRKFWSVADDGKKNVTEWISIYPEACQFQPYLDWKDIRPPYRYQPKRCIDNPRWADRREMWGGRELERNRPVIGDV